MESHNDAMCSGLVSRVANSSAVPLQLRCSLGGLGLITIFQSAFVTGLFEGKTKTASSSLEGGQEVNNFFKKCSTSIPLPRFKCIV